MSLETPILFLIFNRPETTQIVFEEIRKQKPKYLFVAADGPRKAVIEDDAKCKLTRDIVLNGIDWDCELKTLFRTENLGCGLAPVQAINWFFENVEQGIILEDDCLPHPSFFQFCSELLDKYKNNENVFGVSGNNFQNGIQRGKDSYYFSHYSHIWGWASWRRAWKHYEFKISKLESFKKSNLIRKIDNRIVFRDYWMPKFDAVVMKDYFHIWDYQWLFAVWNNKGAIIIPNVNLVSNIGFGVDATHTNEVNSPFANMDVAAITTITHPTIIKIDSKADKYTSLTVFNIQDINNFDLCVSKINLLNVQTLKKVIDKTFTLFKK
jgi:hypothetical protein